MEAIIARGIQVLIALSGAYLVALWFVLVVWTYRDIESRSRSVITQIFSTLLAALFFIPGVLLYLILRPKETLDVAFQRSLEEEYLLQDLEELPLCHSCHRYVEDDFILCPHCHTRLRDACSACGRLVHLRWSLCPYCGAEQS
ncbi:MAG: zinc ribbon domain-containing protein, partial [Chloroflexota bacterium]